MSDKISTVLFGKARRSILGLLFSHPQEAYYLRQIARSTGVGLGAAQREVNRLSAAGIIRRIVQGRQVYFQANTESPVFAELKSLVMKTVGAGEVVQAALIPLSNRIQTAFVYGSVARGEERGGSDIDVLVVGDVTFAQVVAALSPCQQQLGREINPTVFPAAEFKSKLAALRRTQGGPEHGRRAAGHHFLRSVLARPKFFLIGGERELAVLVGKQVVD
jgi:predicted nucleotidyltransferase